MVSFSEASRIVREQSDLLMRSNALPWETVRLLGSLGRVLAEPVIADRDQPPFARSTRDGFACRAADLQAGDWLEVVGQIRAGGAWDSGRSQAPLSSPPPPDPGSGSESHLSAVPSPRQAVEIMTGAPVPEGADCVVMLEHVQQETAAEAWRIRLDTNAQRRIEPGANIVARGAESRAGELVVRRGTRMGPAQIGVAASCGSAEVRVFAAPQVAVVATGDELVELDKRPLPFQIRNSNSYSLAAQILAAGGEPMRLGIARDRREDIEGLIGAALHADLLLLSGGVSVGKYDLVEAALLALGAEFFFTGALIQPGKPALFGRIPRMLSGPRPGTPLYFFGLPGNPVSTMVTFSIFVTPFLAVLGGEPWRGPRFAQARLSARIADAKNPNAGRPGRSIPSGASAKPGGLTRFVPALLESDITGGSLIPTVTPVAWQGSGDLSGSSQANCFLVLPETLASAEAGETVTILL